MVDPLLPFDARTLLVVTFTSSILMAAVLGFVFAGRFRDGLASWTQSLWVQALAWLLIALHGAIPGLISVAAANALLSLGWSLQFAAVLEFQRRSVPSVLVCAPAVIVFALYCLLIDDLRIRLIVSGALYGAFYSFIAAAALSRRPAYGFRAYGLFAGGFLAAAVTLFLRSAAAWAKPEDFTTALGPQPIRACFTSSPMRS